MILQSSKFIIRTAGKSILDINISRTFYRFLRVIRAHNSLGSHLPIKQIRAYIFQSPLLNSLQFIEFSIRLFKRTFRSRISLTSFHILLVQFLQNKRNIRIRIINSVLLKLIKPNPKLFIQRIKRITVPIMHKLKLMRSIHSIIIILRLVGL